MKHTIITFDHIMKLMIIKNIILYLEFSGTVWFRVEEVLPGRDRTAGLHAEPAGVGATGPVSRL